MAEKQYSAARHQCGVRRNGSNRLASVAAASAGSGGSGINVAALAAIGGIIAIIGVSAGKALKRRSAMASAWLASAAGGVSMA